MTSAVKRSVPPPTLVKMGNPLVRMLLGSPLHGVLDDRPHRPEEGTAPARHLAARRTSAYGPGTQGRGP